MKPPIEESHPFLPSGEWEGFYCYQGETEQHRMSLSLTFTNGKVNGDGVDDIAPFTWKGTYDLGKFKIDMDKRYPSHAIAYKGDIDENGIWGMWSSVHQIPDNISPEIFSIIADQLGLIMSGGFHIWPKKMKSSSNKNTAIEAKKESKKLLPIANKVRPLIFYIMKKKFKKTINFVHYTAIAINITESVSDVDHLKNASP